MSLTSGRQDACLGEEIDEMDICIFSAMYAAKVPDAVLVVLYIMPNGNF